MGTSGQSNSPSIIEKAPVRLFVSRCDEPGSKNITAIIGMKKVDGDILFRVSSLCPSLSVSPVPSVERFSTKSAMDGVRSAERG